MTRHTKQIGVRTRRNLLATVLVLALVGAFAALGLIIHTQGVPGPATNSLPPLPPAKATILARSQQAIATARAAPRAPKTLSDTTPVVMPTATFTTGITHESQGPFSNSDFSIDDDYRGSVNGHWVVIYAGTAWITFPKVGNGALRVYNLDTGMTIYDAPDGSSNLNITGVSGTKLQLVSDKGTHLTFDMATNTFGS